MKSITLSKPIQIYNEKISVLEIQEPTFDQVEKFGIPFSYSERGDMRLDTRSALSYLPELAGIPRSSAQQMALHDVFLASMTIVSFFTGAQSLAVSDDDSTTLPGSGA
ncbi:MULTISPECIES: phage tail assembly protein [Symbiopectobacterium]|uniref:phage tail assembly protein n=1 Tax=Symbiopectobacterium TaxID=801 RepID=UPI001A2B430F|nr:MULTISPECIES: phage tail assembly protein [Symbiopectobacterium]MBG6249441.1 phage tail assembly protein [Candidatus Symbiopectobacterium sp. PLON1]MBT9429951.1 phage tail assembly protein [Candidatus Symbiopectobacterium endolongispinus]